MKQPDIVLFMSDQHGGLFTSVGGDPVIQTPNLERIASSGVTFEQAYTASPLCVPARSSFLTAQLPSKTGIFDNKGAIPEDKATFLHSLAIAGYETVLCGRMHFLGHNQRHGFTKRIMGDFTITNWGERTQFLNEQHDYQKTLSHIGCTRVVGGGDSPVLEYDRAVIARAIDYLSEPHDKPQCIIIGTYAPHFSYVAPEELYNMYKPVVEGPETLIKGCNYDHPLQHATAKSVDFEHIKKIRAAYYGMITNLDRQVGEVFDAFQAYQERYNREGIFLYTSDHGDQIGERNIFGKMTHYEGSSKIPLLFHGTNIPAGYQYEHPVSLLDIGITLCDLVGAQSPPDHDGVSLLPILQQKTESPNRYVITEFVRQIQGEVAVSRSVRYQQYKLITYADHPELDLLFDVEKDRYERNNLVVTHPDIYQRMRSYAYQDWNIDEIRKTYRTRAQNHRVINQFGDLGFDDFSERRPIPTSATKLPKTY